MSLIIDPNRFSLEQGTLATFTIEADSGRTKTGAFCPRCGVRIYNRTSALMSLKAGTLDDTSRLKPDAHYWFARRQNWFVLGDDIPHHQLAPGSPES